MIARVWFIFEEERGREKYAAEQGASEHRKLCVFVLVIFVLLGIFVAIKVSCRTDPYDLNLKILRRSNGHRRRGRFGASVACFPFFLGTR